MTSKKLTPPPSLGRALNYATGACNALCQHMLAPHDLTLAQWVILSALWRRDGLPVGEVAEYTGNNGPAVSRILDRMEDKGLVARQQDAGDRRAVRVWLTERSEGLRHLQTFWRQVNERLLEGVSDEDVQRLFGLLGRIERNARTRTADEPC
ncbi:MULTISPECIES: MarR family transcriptional regulator [unclassified Roseitalea]|uniref:MarR family winged helix-turn-helix transcriptional regulator n=1 Tax=unclassified Roseitalea TaxID=2639107 RepID=UPI00273EFFE3|nr:MULTISPECIES: MarR family transcriptional regulator [unclassified Roseitalea]